jgi:ubiquinone/menaquinone biosynthesis C-methylase UbiE
VPPRIVLQVESCLWLAFNVCGDRLSGRLGVVSNLSKTSKDATKIQRQYYTETAARYDSMHANEGGGDTALNEFILAMLRMEGVRSLLDVGSATGRGLTDFAKGLPGALVCGVEPVAALLTKAVEAGVLKSVTLVRGNGESLPFPDASFDAVCEFSILHHVPDPSQVVSEMLRVARKMVVITDSNRFGQGSLAARWFKLFLYKAGLWGAFNYIRTKGKYYQISEGDGLFYSYSVYDSYELIDEWAERVVLVPTGPAKSKSWLHPLLTSEALILIGFRKGESEQPLAKDSS